MNARTDRTWCPRCKRPISWHTAEHGCPSNVPRRYCVDHPPRVSAMELKRHLEDLYLDGFDMDSAGLPERLGTALAERINQTDHDIDEALRSIGNRGAPVTDNDAVAPRSENGAAWKALRAAYRYAIAAQEEGRDPAGAARESLIGAGFRLVNVIASQSASGTERDFGDLAEPR